MKFLTSCARCLIILLFVSIGTTNSTAAVRPATGDLYYNGAYYLDSYYGWFSPGPFPGSNPGYEHDLKLQDTYFVGNCSAFSNMPDWYDDCGTAGVSDPPGFKIYGAGSYDANAIPANTSFFTTWSFDPVILFTPGTIELWAQPVEHAFCPFDFPWCMNGAGPSTQLLQNGPWLMHANGLPTIIYW